jgi:CRISPR-associated protein Csm4
VKISRITILPKSPWRTPWQADTLAGALCTVCARCFGVDVLRAKLIDPMRAGEPPFVLSDAFPGDLMPIPLALRFQDPPAGIDPATIQRAKWLNSADFHAACRGRAPSIESFVGDPLVQTASRHNTLSREWDGALEDGGSFSRSGMTLPQGTEKLSLYFRSADKKSTELLLDLLYELSLTGFGADIATGYGQFEIAGDPVDAKELDAKIKGANAAVSLSTFQPSATDPVKGCWESFSKFGKLGPGLGIADVRKNTTIMFRPGACFAVAACPPFLGHAITMDALLGADRSSELRTRDIEIIQPAFGLVVPALVEASVLQ